MDLSPQSVSSTTFRTVKKGYDPDEVASYLAAVADELEQANERATAMEARARAALAKLQEASQAANATPPGTKMPTLGVDEAETISRTLLLAQRTADTTVAEAEAEAAAIRASASDEVAKAVDAAREQAARLVDEARAEARRAGDSERMRVEGEVQSLLARREFLLSDVHHLEEFVTEQRHRLLAVAELIQDLAERNESGLGDMRPPLVSAAADGLSVSPRTGLEPEARSDADAGTGPREAPEQSEEFDPIVESQVNEDVHDEETDEVNDDVVDAPPPDATPVASSTLPGLGGEESSVRPRTDGELRIRTDL